MYVNLWFITSPESTERRSYSDTASIYLIFLEKFIIINKDAIEHITKSLET